jgi:predicted secreted Zn-dependent protease
MMTGSNALRLIAAALLVSAPSLMARAAPRVTTKYVYFNAAGTTDARLFSAVRAHGPVVSGRHAFARTRMKASVSAKMMRKGGRCAIRKVDFRLKFIIAVPRAAQRKNFSPALSRRWRQFRKHLVWHEKRHRAIWLKCAREAERRIRRLTAASCVSLNRRMKAEYHKAMRECDALHAAFDAREQRAIMRDPFVRAALGLSRSRRASR